MSTMDMKFAGKMRQVAEGVRAKKAEDERLRQAMREAELGLQRNRVGELAKKMLQDWYSQIRTAAEAGQLSVKIPFSPLVPRGTKQEDIEMAGDMAVLVLHLHEFDATVIKIPDDENSEYYLAAHIMW
jgi:hypothetical protein